MNLQELKENNIKYVTLPREGGSFTIYKIQIVDDELLEGFKFVRISGKESDIAEYENKE